jgi:hypothetical protein
MTRRFPIEALTSEYRPVQHPWTPESLHRFPLPLQGYHSRYGIQSHSNVRKYMLRRTIIPMEEH